MSLLSALGAGLGGLKSGPGQAQPMGQAMPGEAGPRPPMMAAPPPPHPALAAFPEYPPDQAIAMWNNAYKPGQSANQQSNPAATGFGPTDSRLLQALGGNQ